MKEEFSGTSPKVKVRDARGRDWSVKLGSETHSSSFSSHFAADCGYITETEYFIASGRILQAHSLKRAAPFIGPDGTFTAARFQLRSKWPKFLEDRYWTWTNNPFLGTPQLNGLRIVMMLLSNWDAKDARDFPDVGVHSRFADSNLAIFEVRGYPQRYEYFVSDLGRTLGKWGSIPLIRDNWDPEGYASQTPGFVRGVEGGFVLWGFSGTHAPDITRGIPVTDVRWLLQYLGRITDGQILSGLQANGATREQAEIWQGANRARIGNSSGLRTRDGSGIQLLYGEDNRSGRHVVRVVCSDCCWTMRTPYIIGLWDSDQSQDLPASGDPKFGVAGHPLTI